MCEPVFLFFDRSEQHTLPRSTRVLSPGAIAHVVSYRVALDPNISLPTSSYPQGDDETDGYSAIDLQTYFCAGSEAIHSSSQMQVAGHLCPCNV